MCVSGKINNHFEKNKLPVTRSRLQPASRGSIPRASAALGASPGCWVLGAGAVSGPCTWPRPFKSLLPQAAPPLSAPPSVRPAPFRPAPFSVVQWPLGRASAFSGPSRASSRGVRARRSVWCFTHPPAGAWVVSTSGCCEQCCVNTGCGHHPEMPISVPSDKCPAAQRPGRTAAPLLTLRGTCTLFSSAAALTPPQRPGFPSLHVPPALAISCLFDAGHADRCEEVSHRGFDLQFLD